MHELTLLSGFTLKLDEDRMVKREKLRKSAGLQVSDRVEMYYEVVGCKDAKETKAMEEALAQSLTRHIVKRLRQVPRPAASFLTATEAVYRAEVARETLKEVDIVAKGSFVLILTKPALGVSRAAVQSLVEATVSAEAAAGGVDHWVKALTAYLHSVDYARLVSVPQVSVHLDEQTFVLVRDVHYSASPALSE
eukprot:gene11678-8319_t